MTEEWCREKLEKLKIRENRTSTLQEIRGQLTEAPNLEAVVTNRLLSAPEIYDCLDDSTTSSGQSEELYLATDILSICMSNLTISQNDLPHLLERSITHPKAKIRALALNTILRELQQQHAVPNDDAFLEDNLLQHVLKALQEDETAVGVPAIGILSIVLENRLDQGNVKQALLEALKRNETIKCRVFELAVNLGKRSSKTLQKVEFLLDHALSELDNDDILVQVNIMEILVSLAEQNHGLIFLEKQQVFEVISKRIETLEQNPLDRLLVPGIMKFFGKIACSQPQKIITGYPHMIHCLFECIHSADISILPSAFDTLANLAQTQQGKFLLEENYASELRSIFTEYSSYLRNLPSELKNRAFNTLEVIFYVDGACNDEISDLLHKWFTYLANSPNMQFLMDFCRNPFPDIKVACLSFIKAICRFNWGITALKETAGFIEYLLDRKIEFDKEAKHVKFELLKILSESNIFDVHTHMQIQRYINEGPFFVDTSMEVALEGN